MVVQRREHGGGAVDLAHAARVPVALDHTLEKYRVNVVRQCAGVIAAVTIAAAAAFGSRPVSALP